MFQLCIELWRVGRVMLGVKSLLDESCLFCRSHSFRSRSFVRRMRLSEIAKSCQATVTCQLFKISIED